MNYIEMLGTLAGFVSTIAFLPQAVKVWKTKGTKGISLTMYVLYSIGLILWGVYAYLIDSQPLFLTEIITLVMAAYILFMKLREK